MWGRGEGIAVGMDVTFPYPRITKVEANKILVSDSATLPALSDKP